MKKNIFTISQLKRIHPKVKDYLTSALNEDICQYLSFFIDNKPLLTTALIQNPLGKNTQLEQYKKIFGSQVVQYLQLLNRLYNQDERVLKEYARYKSVIILYLANFKVLFDHYSTKEIEKMFSTKALRYSMKLLEKNDITEIRLALEDHFFALLEPEVYRNYLSLLKFTKKKFLLRQKEILKSFHQMMGQSHVQAKIEGRLKTIYSIHNKILKKNILFSQILDTIGIRIMVTNEEACYRCMAAILKNYPIMTSRIKDYIAVPKPNGYKSIHLTILYEQFPVEIQIRTYEMHDQAQFGKASHASYKKHETH